jgi:hypothetical protein
MYEVALAGEKIERLATSNNSEREREQKAVKMRAYEWQAINE